VWMKDEPSVLDTFQFHLSHSNPIVFVHLLQEKYSDGIVVVKAGKMKSPATVAQVVCKKAY
jgi:hypothetical protein